MDRQPLSCSKNQSGRSKTGQVETLPAHRFATSRNVTQRRHSAWAFKKLTHPVHFPMKRKYEEEEERFIFMLGNSVSRIWIYSHKASSESIQKFCNFFSSKSRTLQKQKMHFRGYNLSADYKIHGYNNAKQKPGCEQNRASRMVLISFRTLVTSPVVL